MHEPAGAVRSVFVDPTGRRGRLVARTCWLLGGLGVAYVGLVLVALLLPPGLSRLAVPGLGAVLPGPAAAPLGAAQGEVRAPDALLAPPSPRPDRSTAPAARPSAAPTQRTVPAASPPPPTATSRPTPAPTDAPTAAPGPPTTPPGRKATQPPAAPPDSTRGPKPRPTRGPR